MGDAARVGQVLYAARVRTGWSQAELSRQAGVEYSQVSPLEELLEVAHLLVDVGDALRLHTLDLENLFYRLLGIAWILLALCWQPFLHLQVLARYRFIHLSDGHISNTLHKILTTDLMKQHSARGDVGSFLLS